MSTHQELIDYFKYRCEKGFIERGLDKLPPDKLKVYRDRLEYETKVIVSMGFSGYFLITWDILKFARENKIPCGIARGSAAASIVSYCLHITHLDPIEWDLPFSRFLNEHRISMPDIDNDVSESHRHLVLDYISHKYGAQNVAHIGTFGTMRAKNAIKNVARALGHPYEVGEELSKLLLPAKHGKPQPLSKSTEEVSELKEHYNKQGAYGEILRWAEKFEGLVNSVGVHACGICIANEQVSDSIPLFVGRGGEITSQWEMNNLEKLGYIKFDVLGLAVLSKIALCLQHIKQRHNIDIDIYNLDWKDDGVFEQFRRGNLQTVFQFETSSGFRDITVKVRPNSLKDLSTLVAVYRPGPLGSDGLQGFLSWRAGEKEPEYLIPELEPILKDTGSMLVYQEQCMKIATDLCGYTSPESDNLRKIIGKKLPEKMKTEEEKFKRGWTNSGHPAEAVDILWKNLVDFSSYAFNKCITGDTQIKTINGNISVDSINENISQNKKVKIQCLDIETYNPIATECVEVINTGVQDVYEIELSDGSKINCTLNHKFLCSDNKYYTLREILDKNLDILAE